MIREICKYVRRFRWLIGAYVLWILLTTFLTSTHQAFVHPSVGVRQFAWVLEGYATSVSLCLLLPLLVFLSMEDNLWDSKALWRLRPVEPRTLLAAKVVLVMALASLLPFAAVFLSSVTAGVSLVGAFTASFDHALWVSLFAISLCSMALIAKNWSDLAMILALCVVGAIFHLACWMLVAESKALAGRFYAGAGIALGLFALWKAAQARDRESVGLIVLMGYVVGLPFVTVLVAGLTTSSNHDRGFNSEKAHRLLMASLVRTPGASHVGGGLKLGYDVDEMGVGVLRYWYQGAQRSLGHQLNARPGASSDVDDATRSIFPNNVRVRLEIPLASEEGSDEVLVNVRRWDERTEHRVR